MAECYNIACPYCVDYSCKRTATCDMRLDGEYVKVKHGRWLMTDAYPHRVYCSECYATLIPNVEWFKTYNIASNYCPNCGSRMDLDGGTE